jgi:hypothetical protein
MGDFWRTSRLVLLCLLLTAAVSYGGLLVLQWVDPALTSRLGLGNDLLLATLAGEVAAASHALRLNAVLDLTLLAGSYLFVSLSIWAGRQLKSYIDHAYNFRGQ